jgi:isopentenyl diphosphate isomerase/L-lactate dehydrogenase-like FMN-dependent dehydrogenase
MVSSDGATEAATFQTLHEFIAAARLRLNQFDWDYLVGGSETETTLRRNRYALDSLAFRPRVLVDVSKVDCGGQFFGKRIRLPVALGAVGSLDTFAPSGPARAVEASGQFGIPVFISSVSTAPLDQIAAAGAGPKVFQLYVRHGDNYIDDQVRRAIDAGYEAFCITVDSAHYSRRERDIAKRFAKPWRGTGDGQGFQAELSWKNIERFKTRHQIPLILKGIASAEDARLCCETGVDVVYVSNHGGRQLDHGRGAMDILPEVVDAVGGRAQIYVDGGFSRGGDIVKGMALGADLVVIGRLYLYALVAAGAAGVVRLLEILQEEVEGCLKLLGVTSFGGLDATAVCAAPSMCVPHVHAAFPLLSLEKGD